MSSSSDRYLHFLNRKIRVFWGIFDVEFIKKKCGVSDLGQADIDSVQCKG